MKKLILVQRGQQSLLAAVLCLALAHLACGSGALVDQPSFGLTPNELADESGSGSDQVVPTPTPAPFVVLYQTTATTNGNLGGRAGADAFCQANKPAEVNLPLIRAFISISSTDEIRDLPANYGVPTDQSIIGINGVVIADDWADLLDGSIDGPTQSAGMPDPCWVSSTLSGEITTTIAGDDATCFGFTLGDNTALSSVSVPDQTSDWISAPAPRLGRYYSCGHQLHLMCIAYDN